MGHTSYTSKRRDPVTFDIDGGPTFTARGGLGSVVLELGELAKLKDLEADTPEGMSAIAKFFEMLLGPDEYARFRAHVAESDIDPETILDVLSDLFTQVVGHPKQPPSDSSPGPTNAPPTLRVISSSDNSIREEYLTPEREAELIAQMENELAPGIG